VAKPSNRERILSEGLRVVLERGYCGASVRDIVQAAGVPQGSFTNHFSSKEAFSLEVLDLYFARVRENIARTLGNEAIEPLQRLRAWIDLQIDFLQQSGMRTGCLIGNFSVEATDSSELIRTRLERIIHDIQRELASCLKAAVKAGDLPASSDCDELAKYLYASLQGAISQSKVEQSPAPIERFKRILFSTILREGPQSKKPKKAAVNL
jgi:TetR/AcrR family transcriptional repressor of nem operon